MNKPNKAFRLVPPARIRKTLVSTSLAVAILTITGCDDDDYDFHHYDVPNSVTIVDMNGDGGNDIVFAATHVDGSYPNAGFAGVILQSAATAGTFQSSLSVATGYNPSTLAFGNLDSASGPDIVVANSNSGDVSVLLHDASTSNAQLQSARSVATGGIPYDVAVGDTNNDGLPDIAVADAGASNNIVLLRRSAVTPGTFLALVTLSVGNPSTAVAIADLNGDGRSDIAVANIAPGGAGRVSVFIQSAVTAGTFASRSDYPAGTEPLALKIGDLNNDGRVDLVVANEGAGSNGSGSSGVSVLLQSATTAGIFLAPTTYATARGSVSVAIGDFNLDGFNDLAVANTGGSYSGTVSVLLQDNTRPGIFLSTTNYPGVYEPLGVAVGDLNRDGIPDLAVADGSRATVMFNSATTPGTFASPVRVGR
jgi:FG-GAP-like repeat